MIHDHCPCCEVTRLPHEAECSLHIDAPEVAEVFDELAELRAEIDRLRLTVGQIAAIRTCLHHTIRRFEEKSLTAANHYGGVPQIECGGINVTAEIMDILAVAEASLTDEQREMLPEVI